MKVFDVKNPENKIKNPINRLKQLKALGMFADFISYSCYGVICFIYDWRLAVCIWLILFTTGLRTYAVIVKTVREEIGKQFISPIKENEKV